MRKRIKVIVPNITPEFNQDVYRIFERIKDADTEVDVCNIGEPGALYLTQKYDVVWSGLSVLQAAEQAERDGYDGVFIYCALDPARTALREALNIPVVSMFEAALHITAALGDHFSVICPMGSRGAREELIHLYRMDAKFVSVEFFDLGVGGLSDAEGSYKIIARAAQDAVGKGADSLIFGCGAMMGVAKRLSDELGIPVVEPGPVAFKLLEAMIGLGLKHSKVTYRNPIRHDNEERNK